MHHDGGMGSLGSTNQPFVWEGVPLAVGLEGWRGDAFPASIVQLLGPGFETVTRSLPHQPAQTCYGAAGTGFEVVAP